MISYNGDDGLSDSVKKALGDNPLVQEASDKDNEQKKYEVFCNIQDLVDAARSLYCDKSIEFDTVLGYLSDALLKLKGKEQDLTKGDEENEDENPE